MQCARDIRANCEKVNTCETEKPKTSQSSVS
jgi:hypothetical protein